MHKFRAQLFFQMWTLSRKLLLHTEIIVKSVALNLQDFLKISPMKEVKWLPSCCPVHQNA